MVVTLIALLTVVVIIACQAKWEWLGVKRPCWAVATWRWNSMDTTVYWYGYSLGWNSEHIAKRWGVHSDGEMHVPEIYVYEGWLGYHLWV